MLAFNFFNPREATLFYHTSMSGDTFFVALRRQISKYGLARVTWSTVVRPMVGGY